MPHDTHQQLREPIPWSAADPIASDDIYAREAMTIANAANAVAYQGFAGLALGTIICLVADALRGTHHFAAIFGLAG